MAKAVFSMMDSDVQAERAINELKNAGFPNQDISVLWPDKNNKFGFEHKKATKSPEGAVAGATTGGVLGATLGWLAGVGLLAIPGVGPFVAAGPIMAALSGAAIGASVGGLAGALIGIGVPEIEAKRYEEGLKQGKVLVAVHADNNDEAKRAEALFKSVGGRDISSSHEISDEKLAKKQGSASRDTGIRNTDTTEVFPPPIDRSQDYPRGV